MVDFDEMGKETWDKTKVYRVETLKYWDETQNKWNGVIIGRTEFLTSRKTRKMIEAIKGD